MDETHADGLNVNSNGIGEFLSHQDHLPSDAHIQVDHDNDHGDSNHQDPKPKRQRQGSAADGSALVQLSGQEGQNEHSRTPPLSDTTTTTEASLPADGKDDWSLHRDGECTGKEPCTDSLKPGLTRHQLLDSIGYKAGLRFPLSKVKTNLSKAEAKTPQSFSRRKVSSSSSVYLSGVLEYLTQEMLNLAAGVVAVERQLSHHTTNPDGDSVDHIDASLSDSQTEDATAITISSEHLEYILENDTEFRQLRDFLHIGPLEGAVTGTVGDGSPHMSSSHADHLASVEDSQPWTLPLCSRPDTEDSGDSSSPDS